jgi:hypothetical protein
VHPEVQPAVGEDAGARGGHGVGDADQDAEKEVIGEAADAVDPAIAALRVHGLRLRVRAAASSGSGVDLAIYRSIYIVRLAVAVTIHGKVGKAPVLRACN